MRHTDRIAERVAAHRRAGRRARPSGRLLGLAGCGIAVGLTAACAAPSPAPPPGPPATPTAPVMLFAPTPRSGAPVERDAGAPPGDAAPREAPPAGPTPTAIAGEIFAAGDAAALAAAAAADSGQPATSAPTNVALPPSARELPRQVPTAAVLASSPAPPPSAATEAGSADYGRAIKLVQDARKAPATPRLEERIDSAIARARSTGSDVEVVGWQATLKGTTTVYQVIFGLRENRQGLRAEWEVDLATGAVRPTNPLAEALEGS
jgi:hypothetical protein